VSDFNLWFFTGLEHIADWQGYDHILFLAALCSIYSFKQYKTVLILISSFTIGHSLTLALSTLSIIHFSSKWIELLIPITIIITATNNLLRSNSLSKNNFQFSYTLALFFGFIHGMGFSILLKSLLGKSESVISALFAFNLGLEAGQILIIAVILTCFVLLDMIIPVKEKIKKITISLTIIGIALLLTLERLLILF